MFEGFQPNQRLVFEKLFKDGDLVDITDTTIGKGFQGFAIAFLTFLFNFSLF